MASLNKVEATGVLKEHYLPVVRVQINQRSEVLSQIEQSSDDVDQVGLEAVLSLQVGANEGIGSRLELEELPEPGAARYIKARVPLKYHYAQLQVSGPVIRAMRTDEGSWIRALESEQKGATTGLRQDLSRQALGSGDGVIAQLAANVAGSTTLTVVATPTQLRSLRRGMKIDIGTVASPASVASNRTIVAVNRTAKTITVDVAVAGATTTAHFIFRQGSGGAGASQRELTGLAAIISGTGTLFGVNPATEDVWASNVLANGGGVLTDGNVNRLIDEVSINSPDGVGNWAITTHRIVREYANSLTKTFSNTTELNGGFTAIEVGTASGRVALQAVPEAPQGRLYLVNREHLTMHEASDWEFMEEDGSALQRITVGFGKDGYQATLFAYKELATDMRAAHGLITGIQDDA